MKSRPTATIVIVGLCLALAGAAILWLGNAHVTPPVQTVTQPISDDRIPH
jgi:hypothetical protein